jgi:hypothetical protein
LPAEPYLTGGVLVLNGMHLLASVHPTRAIYQPLAPITTLTGNISNLKQKIVFHVLVSKPVRFLFYYFVLMLCNLYSLKGEVILVLIYAVKHYAMKAYGEWRYSFTVLDTRH